MSGIVCECGRQQNVAVFPFFCPCGITHQGPQTLAAAAAPKPKQRWQEAPAWTEPESCRHRGREVQRVETCRLCGRRGESVEIFKCDIFGECSIKKWRAGQPEGSCLGCQRYEQQTESSPVNRRSERRAQRRAERELKESILGPWHHDPLNWWRYYDGEMRSAYLSDLWRGSAGFLVAGGPSLKDLDLSFLRDRGVVSLGVNNVAAHAPVRAMVCSDPPEKFHHAIWLDPSMMKLIPANKFNRRIRRKLGDGKFEKPLVRVKECPNVWGFTRDCDFLPEEFLLRESATWGRNEAAMKARPGREKLLFTFLLGLRLMWALGCRRTYLLGADFGMRPGGAGIGYAFGQNRDKEAANSNNNSYRVAGRWLQELRPIFEKVGYEVYQTNPNSKLRVFDYCPLEHAIADARGIAGNDALDLAGWYEKEKGKGDIKDDQP